MSNISNISNTSNTYRYILEKGSKKHHCPDCNKKTLVRYIDKETCGYLPEQYGRCDRESKCSYHLNPYLDGYAKAIREQESGSEFQNNRKPQLKKSAPKATYDSIFFDFNTFKQTLVSERYEKNTFIQNLLCRVQFPFEIDDVTKIIELYRLGTVANGYRAGANTFPFIDVKGNVRAIQVKQFDEQNHTLGTDFLHSIIEKHHTRNNMPLPGWLEAYSKQGRIVSCLFGEHLLGKYHSNPVALVEAPKTAIYSTLYFGIPETSEDFIWLAVYNKSSFSFDKLKVLQGRFVYVFPDLSKDGSTFKEWESKAKEYESRLLGTRFIFSNLLEHWAPERDKVEGNDLADFLIKLDWRQFRKRKLQVQPPQHEPESVTSVTKVTRQQNNLFSLGSPLQKAEVLKTNQIEHPVKEQVPTYGNDIAELESFFANIILPTQPVRLNPASTIIDCAKFIKSHIATLKENNVKRTFLPYLNRLHELKKLLKT